MSSTRDDASTTDSETARVPADGAAGGISVLRNSFAVLRAFSVDEPLLGVTDIASVVGLHKSTVSRILATLEAEDIVERDPVSRRFRLGLGIIGLAGPLLADLDVRHAASPVLRETSERTGETTALMVWSGTESVCVEQVASRHQVKHSTPLGTRYTTLASSSVQVFLAHRDPRLPAAGRHQRRHRRHRPPDRERKKRQDLGFRNHYRDRVRLHCIQNKTRMSTRTGQLPAQR